MDNHSPEIACVGQLIWDNENSCAKVIYFCLRTFSLIKKYVANICVKKVQKSGGTCLILRTYFLYRTLFLAKFAYDITSRSLGL